MKFSRLIRSLFYVAIVIEILSFVAMVSGNRPHGKAADEAFARWSANRTPENEEAFHREMDKLEEQPRRIRRYGTIAFSVTSGMLLVLLTLRRSPYYGGKHRFRSKDPGEVDAKKIRA
jgi:hypothetical protein